MKESAVPSVWPLCPLGAQTPGSPDTRGGRGGKAPQLQHSGPVTACSPASTGTPGTYQPG